MDFELISEEEYASLPDDDDRCFVEFESICRRNMTKMINEETSHDFDRSIRQQYMAAVAAVASECNIPNVIYSIDNDRSFIDDFNDFSLSAQSEVARIRIRQRGHRHPYSVLLTPNTRTKVQHYIDRIREMISKSDMHPDRKRNLFDKLDELTSELNAQRLSLAKTMMALMAITTATASITTIAASGQAAVAQIMQLIGLDKETEDAASKRLAPPPKALPSPRKVPVTRPAPSRRYDVLDDDIPF